MSDLPTEAGPGWAVRLGLLCSVLSAALAALIEICLVPLYVGAAIVPVTVALAVISNVGLPILVRRLGAGPFVVFLPVAVWIAVVILLASSRPEGDVLLPGGGAAGVVGLALLAVGVLSGVISGVVLSGRGRRRDSLPGVPATPVGTGSGSRGGASSRAG